MKDFVVIDFSEYFNILNLRKKAKLSKETVYSKLSKVQTLKVAEFLYIFLTTYDEVEKHVKMMQ